MIKHILKNGTELKDITGHVVKVEDAQAAYEILRSINEKKKNIKREQVCSKSC